MSSSRAFVVLSSHYEISDWTILKVGQMSYEGSEGTVRCGTGESWRKMNIHLRETPIFHVKKALSFSFYSRFLFLTRDGAVSTFTTQDGTISMFLILESAVSTFWIGDGALSSLTQDGAVSTFWFKMALNQAP